MDLQIPELRRSHFGLDVLILVTGTAFAQIISIIASPIITRLYGPETFGLLAIFTSIAGIFGVIVCLRYELAIVLPKSDAEAANVFGLCLFLLTSISLLLIPILFLLQKYIVDLLNAPQLRPFLFLIPPMIFLSGAFLALNYWNTRTKHFHRLAIAQVTRSCSVTGTQIGIGLLGYASGGILISATILGQFVATFVLSLQIMRDHLHYFKQNITMKGMIAEFFRYSNFPKYEIWSALLNTISNSLPIFILSIFFNITILGYYSLGLTILRLPSFLIGNAIGLVFFQKAAEIKNVSNEKLKDTIERILKPLILLSVFPAIIIMLIGPELFGVVFGNGWQEAGNYARYLSLLTFSAFIATPLWTLFNIFQKQQMNLFFNILQTIGRVIALSVGAIMGSALAAIVLFSFSELIFNVIPVIYLLRLSKVSLLKPAKILVKYFLLSLPFIGFILFIQYVLSIKAIELVIFICIFITIYYFLAIRNEPELLNVLKSITSEIPIIRKFLN